MCVHRALNPNLTEGWSAVTVSCSSFECGGERHGGVARDPGDGVELLARPLGGGQQQRRREHAGEHGAEELL